MTTAQAGREKDRFKAVHNITKAIQQLEAAERQLDLAGQLTDVFRVASIVRQIKDVRSLVEAR